MLTANGAWQLDKCLSIHANTVQAFASMICAWVLAAMCWLPSSNVAVLTCIPAAEWRFMLITCHWLQQSNAA